MGNNVNLGKRLSKNPFLGMVGPLEEDSKSTSCMAIIKCSQQQPFSANLENSFSKNFGNFRGEDLRPSPFLMKISVTNVFQSIIPNFYQIFKSLKNVKKPTQITEKAYNKVRHILHVRCYSSVTLQYCILYITVA